MVLPAKARFAPGEPIVLEVVPRSAGSLLRVEHLGQVVARAEVAAGADVAHLDPLPEGGYTVHHLDQAGAPIDATAVEVLADPVARLRYGFVASFAPGREIDGVLRHFRRLHLTAAQFYDWAYRHADLVAPQPTWHDPLGQPVSIDTVRALTGGLRRGGTLPLGYAAVYGVGDHEWPRWERAALLDGTGKPHRLGDFLSLVDPSDPDWLRHFRADLRSALAFGGFAGFHLDQYGYPRRAVRPDGRWVDLADAFDAVIRGAREELPDACLVFNNVNDFPVWATTRSPQDVTYTEVWEPHDTLADLAAVATRSRQLAPDRPAVLAAYQSVYAHHPAPAADDATRLTMATLFSHGATQLLAGEDGHVLIDPYYVRNHAALAATNAMLRRWYDLLVAAGDLLFAPGSVDVTRSVVGGLNGELDVVGGPVVQSHEARPGTVWRRVVQTPLGTVVHLINLTGQAETGWDTPKATIRLVEGLRLRLRWIGQTVPHIHAADPDGAPGFAALTPVIDGSHIEVELPPLRAWQLLIIRSRTEESQ